MKKRNYLTVFLALLICALTLGTAGCGKKPEKLAEEMRMGEHEDVVRERYGSMSGSTQLLSYSVYKDLSKEQMEAMGKGWYDAVSEGGYITKCSLAFYEGDTDQLLYEFYYTKDGVVTDMEDAYYISGDMFDRFEPEG